jgi:hypothetical protein
METCAGKTHRWALSFLLFLPLTSCGLSSTWYRDWGFASADELNRPESLPKLKRVLVETKNCLELGEVAAALEKMDDQTLQPLKGDLAKPFEMCCYMWPGAIGRHRTFPAAESIARLYKRLDPDTGVRLALQAVTHAEWLRRVSGADTLKILAQPTPEVISALEAQLATEEQGSIQRERIQSALNYLRSIRPKQEPTQVAAGVAQPQPAQPAPYKNKPAAEPQIVAMFDIQDRSRLFSAAVLDQLCDYLMNRLTASANFRFIPRAQLRTRILQEKTESYKSCYEQSCQIELGRALAAQKSLATQILKVGDKCAFNLTLYDLKAETTERAASVRADCNENAIMDSLDGLLEQLK